MPYTVALPDGRKVEFPDSVSQEQAAQIIKAQFYADKEPERTLGGYTKEALKGLIPGAVGLGETAIAGAAALLPEEAEQAIRKPVKEFAEDVRETFAPAPGYEDTAVRKLSEAVGSTLPFLAAGPFGVAGRVAATGLGVSAGAGEARQRAEEAGATEGERGTATALGIIPGALEALPPIRILRRFGFGDEAIKEVAGVAPALGRIAKAGGEEALQEASSQVLQNLIAKGVYAPDEAILGGVGEAAALGGGAGAIVSAIAELALGRRLRGPEAEPTKEEDKVETETEVEAPPAPPEAEPTPLAPEGEAVPVSTAPSRDQLVSEFEEVAEPVDEAAQQKFEATVQKIRQEEAPAVEKELPDELVDFARAKVQESGTTAAPYIQRTINKNLPDQKITLGQASQIRQRLIDEGTILGENKVSKPAVAAAETITPTETITPAETTTVKTPEVKQPKAILIHGGRDFKGPVDFSQLGTGEPGAIRPLGNGLYGYVIYPDSVGEIEQAVETARDLYAKKFGGDKPTIHVFNVDTSADVKQERLPIGLTEMAVLKPERLQRIGKFTADTSPQKIQKTILKNLGVSDADRSPAVTEQLVEGTGRRGTKLPVSRDAATGPATAGPELGGVGDVSVATAEPVEGEEAAAPALKTETVVPPQERYESLQRRFEGLINSRRILAFNANAIRAMLKAANPVTNPEEYQSALDAADTYISEFEDVAEQRETATTAKGIDLREKNLKAQETLALERAQRQIEQDKIAASLRETADRREEAREGKILPEYAAEMQKILDEGRPGGVNAIAQLLVDKRAAANTYPGKAGEKFRPIFETVAKKLRSVDLTNLKVQTEATIGANPEVFKRLMKEAKLAEYDPASNTLYIRRDKVNARTVMHELIHAVTVQTIRQYQLDKSKLTEGQRIGVERLDSTFNLVQNQTIDPSIIREFPAAFENVYEFLAYGLTNPEFQSRLARIEVTDAVERKNLWTEFVKAIGNLFGIKFNSKDSVSALDEIGQAFSEVIAAPREGGITGVKPLAAKKAEKEPKPPVDPFKEVEKKYDLVTEDKLKLSGLVKYLTSPESVEEAVRTWQDEQRPLLTKQRDLDRAGLAIWASAKDGGNTLAAANDESRGRYENYEKVLTPLIANLNKSIAAYKARSGRTLKKAMVQLDTFFIAETSDQRRLTNYLKEKPLKTKPTIRLKGSDQLISYAQYRDMLIDSVQTTQELDDRTRDAIYNRLLQLAGIEIGANGRPKRSADAAKYEDALGASYGQLDRKGEVRKPGPRPLEYNAPYYDIIENWDYKTNNKILDELAEESKLYGNEIKAVREALIALDKVTMQFNAEANYLTQPAKNLIKLYGWDKYVPLMGKLKKQVEKKDQFVYINTVPNEFIPGFRGRADAPDSPIAMVQINAGKAATRAARSDIVPTMVNLLKPHPKTGKSYLEGGSKPLGVIKFTDRYKGEFNFQEKTSEGADKWVGRDKFYNYLPNGDIEVWKVDDKGIVDALRPEWEPTKGIIGRATEASRWLTNLIGQGHTRYQIKFAIYDFPRNVIANSGVIMNELGPVEGAKYFASVGREVFQKLRIPQVWRIASAHYDGDWDKIKKIGGYNPKTGEWKDPFVRDTYQYLERGGRISIIKSWQTRSQLEKIVVDINKADWRRNTEESLTKSKDFIDRYFDLWMDGFELVARVQAFRIAKAQAVNTRNMKEADAERYAVSYAKNLANFEKRGVNKTPSALYAFFAPSATGAVRAVDSIIPAFRIGLNKKNIDKIIKELPQGLRDDPEAVAKYTKTYLQQARNARITMAFFASFGSMMAYMAMSLGGSGDDDEEPVNLVAEDSKELWTRNIRLPLNWLDLPALKDKFVQIPWGFGMGAFAAAGAQTAFFANNGMTKMSVKEYAGNMISIGIDSYIPLPFARFNPFDAPLNWVIGSALPTPLRTFYEYNTNMSGLGQSIYRDYYNRYGPAFAGSENIEEAYRYAADAINKITLGRYQPEPSEVRFLTTAYFDGPAAIVADAVNIGLALSPAKDFDIKTDTVFLDSFVGNKISPALIKFNKANTRIEKLKRGYDTAINSPDPRYRERFLKEYPNAPAIIYVYNKQLAQLSEISQAMSAPLVYAETPKERKELRKEFDKVRDLHMNQVVKWYETYQEDIDDYYRFVSPL